MRTGVSNAVGTVIIVPTSNEWTPDPSVVPERFRSISGPYDGPIVAPELNSTSDPTIVGGSSARSTIA